MLGITRYIFASIVALGHFGEFKGPAGSIAVFGFFAMSGYLMTMTYNSVYVNIKHSVLRYYATRLLRIIPLLTFYLILTIIFVRLHRGTVFLIGHEKLPMTVIQPGVMDLSYGAFFHELTLGFINPSAGSIIHGSNFIVLPQAWSLVLEIQFYALVPLVAYLLRSPSSFPLFILFFISTLVPALNFLGIEFSTPPSKSFIGCFFMFISGSYLVKLLLNKEKLDHKYAIYLFLFGLAFFFWAMYRPQANFGQAGELWFYTGLVTVIVAMAAIIQFKSGFIIKLDKFLGNLSYGIFLNHFLVASLLLWAIEFLNSKGLNYSLDPHPLNPNIPASFHYRIAVLIVSTGMSALTFYFIERPLEKIRTGLKFPTTKKS